MAASAIDPLGDIEQAEDAPGLAATRRAGAEVGAMVGLVAVLVATIPILAGGSFETWIVASVPAGALAGAAVAPGIRANRRLSGGRLLAAAFVAFLVGDLLVSGWFAVETAQFGETPLLSIVLNLIATVLLGVVGLGWLATLFLSPVAAMGALVLRERTRRAFGGGS
jgi:hypothetical protein